MAQPSGPKRLDSWKEIAAYLGLTERTAIRWANQRGLPVHHVPGPGREGMEETLTLHRLGVGPLLRRSLATTNLIESCLGTVRHVARNGKRWQGGDHILRWAAAGLLEARRTAFSFVASTWAGWDAVRSESPQIKQYTAQPGSWKRKARAAKVRAGAEKADYLQSG